MILQGRWSFGIIWNMPQKVLSRPSQGRLGGRLTQSGSKFAPIAALVKALTSGILPAYLTMAGKHLHFASLWNANNLLVSWSPKWNWSGPFLKPLPQPCLPLTPRMMWHGWGESWFRPVQAKPLKSISIVRGLTQWTLLVHLIQLDKKEEELNWNPADIGWQSQQWVLLSSSSLPDFPGFLFLFLVGLNFILETNLTLSDWVLSFTPGAFFLVQLAEQGLSLPLSVFWQTVHLGFLHYRGDMAIFLQKTATYPPESMWAQIVRYTEPTNFTKSDQQSWLHGSTR